MNPQLIQFIQERKPKKELLAFCQAQHCWPDLAVLAFDEDKHLSWRAIWLLTHLDQSQLAALQFDMAALLQLARLPGSSRHRELLKLLDKLSVPEALLSSYFDWAQQLWLDTRHPSSVRISALRLMARIGEQYPELLQEIKAMNSSELLEPLSPGIRQQARVLFESIDA